MRSTRFALPLLAALSLGACAGLTPTEQRTGTGALAGGALGALAGSFAGNAGLGALIGAGVGAGGGYLFDQHEQSLTRSYAQGRADQRRYDARRRGPYGYY